ncbi:AAA family ATPase [Sorangium sp. So ce291]|uniref:AAA family ATPase n=1 Tax=Sorangium sp. So ce291 TaxID=3133294 RepID=UPI003F5E8B1B
MRIDEIRLINFRSFERFALHLEPRLTVLVGRNGTGKTTVLEGLAVALGAWLSFFNANRDDRPIPRSAARFVTTMHGGVPSVATSYPVRVEANGQTLMGPAGWARELRSADGRTTTSGITSDGRAVLLEANQVQKIRRDIEDGMADAEPIALPVLAYYGTGRLWRHKRDKKPEKAGLKSRLQGYRAALEAASDQKGFEAWMAWREEDRVQRLARAAEEGRPLSEVRSPELEGVSAAACACLEGARRIYYSANHQELRVDFRDGSSLPFGALSDGQRNLIAVAADIAWRATQLNPSLGAEAPARATGVVLIDEVELHLHPAWQWRVLDDLLHAFPGLQFVVTTHSPQVMSAAPRGSVRLLDPDHQAHRVDRITGKDANTILEDILGAPSRLKETREKLDELARLIDDGQLVEAKALLAELSSLLGEDDAQIVAARWELSMAETGDAPD